MEVSDIIDAIDAVEYISQYCELEQRGREWWGLSPFKDEKTPSFSLDPETKYYYDFAAGVGGNLIDFVMRYRGVTVRKAVAILRDYAGLEGEVVNLQHLPATKVAKKFRESQKKEAVVHNASLPEDFMDRFEFRRDKLQIWADEGISFDTMRRFGVRYDSLDNRIVYPIRDYEGRLISVCGRTCDPDFKEKKLRKYTYLNSLGGSLNTIYGVSEHMDSILEKKELILFEGAKSVMLASEWGIENCGAVLTSHLSQHQLKYLIPLASFHDVRIVFALDAEVDILKDANIQKLRSYASVEWVRNRDNVLDPKDSPTDKGKEVFLSLYEQRQKL